MTYTWTLKSNGKLIAILCTGHYISMEEAIRILGLEELEKKDPWDADYLYRYANGETVDVWYDDLTLDME